MRESFDSYFMRLATEVSSRSTCTRRHVGAIAVDARNRVIGTGYNGAPSGMKHCTEDTCIRRQKNIPSGQQLDLCKAIHAEANIVLDVGSRLSGATLYCTNQPCTSCFKLLFGAGVSRIVWKDYYPDEYAGALMVEWGIPIIKDGLIHLLSKKHLEDTDAPSMSDVLHEYVSAASAVTMPRPERWKEFTDGVLEGYKSFRMSDAGSRLPLSHWDWFLVIDQVRSAIRNHKEKYITYNYGNTEITEGAEYKIPDAVYGALQEEKINDAAKDWLDQMAAKKLAEIAPHK